MAEWKGWRAVTETLQRATEYPPRMRRPIVPHEAVPIVDDIVSLSAELAALDEKMKTILHQRDSRLVDLWDVGGKSRQRPRGLTYGQIERVTNGAVRESNVRRIIERAR